jgi:broad specificity phosphatase PhoE
MPPTYIFIRHGEALHNVSARKLGDIAYTLSENEDAPLSEEGHRQTLQAGLEIAKVTGKRPVIVFSSPLTRTIQTAENVCQSLNLESKRMDDLIIERLGGGHVCNTRKSSEDLALLYPDWNLSFIQDPPAMPLEREDLGEVQERMNRFWYWVQQEYTDPDLVILIVSHQESLNALHGRDFKNAEYLVWNLE